MPLQTERSSDFSKQVGARLVLRLVLDERSLRARGATRGPLSSQRPSGAGISGLLARPRETNREERRTAALTTACGDTRVDAARAHGRGHRGAAKKRCVAQQLSAAPAKHT